MEVWPAFTDAMLAFVLVLVLMLAYQVGRTIDIAGPDQQEVLADQQRVESLVDSLSVAGVSIEQGLGRQLIRFGSEVLFESGRAEIKPEGQEIIGRIASTIAASQIRTLEEIQVSGHTDNVPTGQGGFSNWELSSARATNVVRSLEMAGIDPARVRLSGTGYGEHAPILSNEADEGRAANRRIEMRLLYTQRGSEPETVL